jgi:hypothetical protein
VEAFHESVDCGMVDGCPGKLNSTQFGQGVEDLWLKRTSLVDGDGLRATEAGQEGAYHGVGCAVQDGDGFWPVREAVSESAG